MGENDEKKISGFGDPSGDVYVQEAKLPDWEILDVVASDINGNVVSSGPALHISEFRQGMGMIYKCIEIDNDFN